MASEGNQLGNDPASDRDAMTAAVMMVPGALLNGTYRIRRLLAEGGMGMVYLATHERLPGYFVVKTLHPTLGFGELGDARLHREAQVLATLNHPNIVKVLDFNRTETGTPYLVMEYLEGRELKDIACTRSLHPWEVVAVVRAISSALAAAHAANVVHGDLKPENVLVVPVVGQEDGVKLIDFGVSNLCMSTLTGLGGPRVILGTPNYMSPEQISGTDATVMDGRSDQFSLAVMAFEMLAGEPPFADVDDARVLGRILGSPPVRLSGRVSWTPRAVEAVLARALEKQPANRYATVLEFSRALEQALTTDLGGAPLPLLLLTTAAPAPMPRPAASRRSERQPTLALPVSDRPRRHARGGVAGGLVEGVAAQHARVAGARRRRRSQLLLWGVTLAVAGLVFLLPPDRAGSLIAASRGLGAWTAQLVRQTIDKGVNKTAAQAGILNPRSSASGSAHPFPP